MQRRDMLQLLAVVSISKSDWRFYPRYLLWVVSFLLMAPRRLIGI